MIDNIVMEFYLDSSISYVDTETMIRHLGISMGGIVRNMYEILDVVNEVHNNSKISSSS